ncbi:MAG: capsular biosynthesis protein [Gammaproteobacteria bacterium]|nr:capsular biosynthesis protein [Gammaproteobacteria bacterium]|tara:strand:+ start:73186 stop:73563 length:378 start_codon:yes stop_codon:yes gene_type:complete
MKRLVIDIDHTITTGNGNYNSASPNHDVVNKIREYQRLGFEIVLYSSRNMRTHNNNIGKILAKTLPSLTNWLKLHKVPYDEIWMGKPWCGDNGFYVDDKAIRPNEFIDLSYKEICQITNSTVVDE